MASPFPSIKQNKYQPLTSGRFFSGLFTVRSPLRDGVTPFMYEAYNIRRLDTLIDGENTEITNKLTLARRPGLSVYNSQTFPAINAFYSFHTFAEENSIRVIVDTDSDVYDATGPDTKLLLLNKSSQAGQTYFQSVGNTLFFGDGADLRKWVLSSRAWKANSDFEVGEFVVDSNNNLQVVTQAGTTGVSQPTWAITINTETTDGSVKWKCKGSSVQNWGIKAPSAAPSVANGKAPAPYQEWKKLTIYSPSLSIIDSSNNIQLLTTSGKTGGSASIANISIASNVLTVTLTGTRPFVVGETVSFSSVATATFLNGQHVVVTSTPETLKFTAAFTHDDYSAPDTGTASSLPVWNATLGGTTTDGTAVWTNKGSADWQANHSYSAGDLVAVTITSYVTVRVCFSGNTSVQTPDGPREFSQLPKTCSILTKYGVRTADIIISEFDGEMLDMGSGELVTRGHRILIDDEWVRAEDAFPNAKVAQYKGLVYTLSVHTDKEEERHYLLANGRVAHNALSRPYDDDPCGTETYEVDTYSFFQCTKAGVSGAYAPDWVDGTGLTVTDGTAAWTNKGNQQTWTDIGAGTSVSLDSVVLDSNGSKQAIVTAGKTGDYGGTGHPSWSSETGKTTIDGSTVWTCQGPFSAAGTASWYYAYAFKNSLTGHVSSASSPSQAITLAANSLVTVQGTGSDDQQADKIQVYRTAQGGSTLFFLAEVDNPGASGQWSYSDLTADADLNEFIQAQISNSNDPPPAGAIIPSYHQGRVWVAVDNFVYASAGPDTTNGSGNESFPPANVFTFPSQVVRLQPYTQGLLVFTVSDVYIILGSGAITNFYSVPFLKGYGLLSYNALDTNGSVFYLMTSDNQALTLDPSSGVSDVGFQIGDVLSGWSPSTTYVTWHAAGSTDKAAYLSDGSTGWYRLNPSPAPETGLSWSPKAAISGGCRAVQSVEVLPGHHHLLVGPASSGQILYRNTEVYTDNGATYPAYATVGNILLAPHGQTAAVSFIGVDCPKIGKPLVIGVLLNEISGEFESLKEYAQDPTDLPPSATVYGLRYYLSQTGQHAICRHLQIKFSWPAEDAASELYDFTLYGCLLKEG